MESKVITLLISFLPALMVALLALYFFSQHVKNEERRRRFLLHKENQKQSLPLRLQAYERMSLFLERIAPNKLLLRIAPIGDDQKSYESLLVNTIEQEFEHNLTQQIYVTDECWNIIKASKNGTINMIRKINMSEEVDSANKLREMILTQLIEKSSPSEPALAFIKNEVSELF